MATGGASGFREKDGVYQSTSNPVALPSHPHQGLAAFLFSGPLGSKSNEAKPLLIDSTTGFSISCGEFHSRVQSVGSGLITLLGAQQGDVILILLGNTIFFPVIFHAILSVGAVATTANPVNTDSEIQRQFRDSGAKFVITMPALIPKLGSLINNNPLVVVNGVSSRPESPNCIPFEALLSFNPIDTSSTIRIRASDPAAILYSSGTTGVSKGVVLSHGNFIAAISVLSGEELDQTSDSVSFIMIPLFHVAGLVFLGCTTLRRATTLVVLPKFDFVKMLEAVQRFRVTSLPMVPPILVALLKSPAVKNYDLTSVKRAGCGAAPLAKHTLEAFLQKFPHIEEFSQGYGMTETTGVGASGAAPFGSAGKLASNHEAKVVDIDTGKPQPPNSRGELWLRGPCLMQNYLNNPTATAATIDSEGWLHTGDIVYVDDQGYLFVVDRLKELIKYKGFQVAPAELEALLLNHPAIADVAVIPYPDDDAGEVPLACVVSAPGKSLSEGDVIEFVATKVAPHKKVRRVVFLREIPKSAAGKILRKDLVNLVQTRSRL